MKRIALLLAIVSMLTACGPKAPNPVDLANESSTAMSGLKSVQFTITHEGDPIVVNPTLGVTTTGGSGEYEAPDKVHATIKVTSGTTVSEAEILWIADKTYLKLPPFMPTFTAFAVPDSFNPSRLFNAEVGIPHVLSKELTDLALAGEEDLDGVPTYHLTAKAAGEAMSGLVGGTVKEGDANVDLWINKDTHQLARAKVTEADGSSWTVDFFGYNEPVDIPTP